MIKCFSKHLWKNFFSRQNVQVWKSRHIILSIFQEIFCCFITLKNTELKNLLSHFDFFGNIVSKEQRKTKIDNRRNVFIKSEFSFQTSTTRPPSTLLPLLKHGSLGVSMKMFEVLVNFEAEFSKLYSFAFDYQWGTLRNKLLHKFTLGCLKQEERLTNFWISLKPFR